MAFQIKDESQVQTRLSVLRNRNTYPRDVMRKLDYWRNMLKAEVERDIWHDVPENSRRWTTQSTFIASVTRAANAMLASDRPKVTTLPKRSYSLQSQDAANFNEEVGMAIFDTLNLHRSQTIEMQAAGHAVHRGNLVAKIVSLDDEERGEVRTPVQPMLQPLPFGEEPAPEFEISEDGDFPILFQLLDPYDCYWTLGKDDRVIEFVHCYQAGWDVLCDEFPGLYDHKDFKDRVGNIDYGDVTVEVIDYWHENKDGIENAVLIDGVFFKEPTPTTLSFMPVVVEEVNAREVPVSLNAKRTMRMGQPFCEFLLELAAEESWFMSLGRSYIEQLPFATLFLLNVDPTDSRNFLMQRRDSDGNPVFDLVMDNTPGGVMVPLPPGVELSYPPVPQMVPMLQEMKAWTSQQMQQLTFSQAILSGDAQGPPSGYAYFQMKQVPMAALGPYEIGLNRFLSRCLKMVNDIIVADWDRMDYPLVLSKLTGQRNEGMQETEITREDFAAVGNIQVRMKVTLPTDKEQEETAIIQQKQMGLMSPTTAIDALGNVQNARKEWEAVMAMGWIEQDPMSRASITQKWMEDNGYPSLQPAQSMTPAEPGVPSSLPGGPPQAAPPGGPPGSLMPPGGPPLPPEAMAGPQGMPPGGMPPEANGAQQIPPELLAQLMAQRGG